MVLSSTYSLGTKFCCSFGIVDISAPFTEILYVFQAHSNEGKIQQPCKFMHRFVHPCICIYRTECNWFFSCNDSGKIHQATYYIHFGKYLQFSLCHHIFSFWGFEFWWLQTKFYQSCRGFPNPPYLEVSCKVWFEIKVWFGITYMFPMAVKVNNMYSFYSFYKFFLYWMYWLNVGLS